MTERIDSEEVVKPNAVVVREPTKFELFLDAMPNLMKHITAVATILVVVIVCIYIIVSKDEELRQFKQTALTAIIGIGTGAIGFLFGSTQKSD